MKKTEWKAIKRNVQSTEISLEFHLFHTKLIKFKVIENDLAIFKVILSFLLRKCAIISNYQVVAKITLFSEKLWEVFIDPRNIKNYKENNY